MPKPLKLRATAEKEYPYSYYISQILGRDRRWTLERTFVGKYAKRPDLVVEYEVTAPGLYLTQSCTADRKKHDCFLLITLDKEGELQSRNIARAEAIYFAFLLDRMPFEEAVRELFPEEDEKERQLELFFLDTQPPLKKEKKDGIDRQKRIDRS